MPAFRVRSALLPSALSNASFLLLDDNPSMLEIIRVILSGYGANHIHCTRDVACAFSLIGETPIDVAIVDYNLAFLDGLAFVRLIRTAPDSVNPFLPIIMLTAHADVRRINEARDAGVTEFCAKPVSANDLARKIDHVILKPRPFVRAPSYFGPDRRRRDMEYTGPDRRAAAADAIPVAPFARAGVIRNAGI